MSITKKIKIQSLELLRNNWTASIVALFIGLALNLIIFALASVVNYTLEYFNINKTIIVLSDIITCVLALFFVSPVFNGILRFFYQLSLTNKAEISEIFSFIKGKNYWKTLLFNIYFTAGLYPFVIIILYSINLYDSLKYFLPQYVCIVIIATVCILSSVAMMFLGIKMVITFFLYADNRNQRFGYYSKATRMINKKHYGDMVKLFFSFTPWLLLCYFVLPVFYVFPYITTSFATSSKWLIKLYKDGKII